MAWKEHTLCGEILNALGDIEDGFEPGDVWECLENVDLAGIMYEWRNDPETAVEVAKMWALAHAD